MKKLLIIMTLFMSSFFLFCNKEVKADITISDTDIDTYITDDFLVMRDEVINQFTNYDYVIFTRSDNSYIILIFESTDTITLDISSISFKGHDWYTYSSSSFNLVFTNHSVNYNFNKILTYTRIQSGKLSYHLFLHILCHQSECLQLQ